MLTLYFSPGACSLASQEIDSMLQGTDWIMGSQYTLADPYALVFYGWGVRGGFPMNELGAYTAWQDRMLKRPAVRKILEIEQNVFQTDVRLT